MNNLRKVLFFVFIISLIITFLLGWIYAGRALRPIAKVIDQVNEISIKSLHLRVDEGKGHDEISKLALTFNKMLTRLENSFTIQENFIANASHEIRTPLTAMSGQLEVVLLNERNPDTYKSVILSVLEEINNMADISNRLLLLARASSEKPATNFKPVRIDEVIWQSKTDLQKRFPGYQINISVSPEIDDENKLIVEGSEQLLNIVIINLMDNGCKFSSDHTVNVTIDHHDQHIQIEFRDHGIGIPEEDQLHILEPFHRGRNAINMKGHGIGLSLVDMLTRHHHGNLSFSSVLNEGSCFCLKFPTKSGT
jgi:signal transduction histidine kinase